MLDVRMKSISETTLPLKKGMGIWNREDSIYSVTESLLEYKSAKIDRRQTHMMCPRPPIRTQLLSALCFVPFQMRIPSKPSSQRTGLSFFPTVLILCLQPNANTSIEWSMWLGLKVQLMPSYLSAETNAVHTTQFSHTVMSRTTLVQLILTCLRIKNYVFAEKVIVAENNGGAQHRQALLEPHQLFSEAPWTRHLHSQPGWAETRGWTLYWKTEVYC